MTAATAMTAQTDEQNHGPTQPHLAKQDAAAVDPSKLTALTPEVVRSFVGSFVCLFVCLLGGMTAGFARPCLLSYGKVEACALASWVGWSESQQKALAVASFGAGPFHRAHLLWQTESRLAASCHKIFPVELSLLPREKPCLLASSLHR